MNYRYCIYTILFFFVLIHRGASQYSSLHLTHYTTANGLAENQVYCVYQSRSGILYVATKNNLNYIDDNKIKVISSPRQDVSFANVSRIT